MVIFLVSQSDHDSYGILGAYETLEEAQEQWKRACEQAVIHRAWRAMTDGLDIENWPEEPQGVDSWDSWIVLERLTLGTPIGGRRHQEPVAVDVMQFNLETKEMETT